jgi:hypothetical protein
MKGPFYAAQKPNPHNTNPSQKKSKEKQLFQANQTPQQAVVPVLLLLKQLLIISSKPSLLMNFGAPST